MVDPVDGTVRAEVGAAGRTEETYLAYSRSKNLNGTGELVPAKAPATFGLNAYQPDDTYGLGGRWIVGTQNVTSTAGISAYTFSFG